MSEHLWTCLKRKLNISDIKPRAETADFAAEQQYLAIVEDDGTDEPPSATSQLTPVHQVLQLTDLHCALKPTHTNHHMLSISQST